MMVRMHLRRSQRYEKKSAVRVIGDIWKIFVIL